MGNEDLKVTVGAEIDGFLKGFDEVKRNIDSLAKHTEQVSQAVQSIPSIERVVNAGAITQLGQTLTEHLTMPILDFGKAVVGVASQMEQSKIAFTTLLGSAEKAGTFLTELSDFAARTPFEFTQLQEASKRMLALGFSAEQVIPTLTNVGNAVAGLGGGADVLNRIILALGQMQAKGKVSAEEMKQLAEAGIPAWQALADAIGTSVPEAMERVQKTQVDSAAAITAIQDAMAQKFSGLMEAQSQTVLGQLSNLKDTTTMIMAELGAEVIEAFALKDVIANVGTFVKDFLTWFKSLDAGTKRFIIFFTGAFAAGGPILGAVGAFMTILATLTAPMLVTGAIVTGIIAGVGLIIANWEKLKTMGVQLWTTLKTTVVSTVQALVDGVKRHIVDRLTAVFNMVTAPIDKVKGLFQSLYQAVVGGSYVPDLVTQTGQWMAQLPTVMVPPAQLATQQTAAAFQNLGLTVTTVSDGVKQEFFNLSATTTQTLEQMAQAIGQTSTQAMAAMATAFATGSATVGQILLNLIDRVINMMFETAITVMGIGKAISAALQAMWIPGVGVAIIGGLLAALIAARAAFSAKLAQLASGGIVTGPTLALVGEAGPEAIVPLSGGRGKRAMAQMGGLTGMGGQQTIIWEISGREVARIVAPEIVSELRLRLGALA